MSESKGLFAMFGGSTAKTTTSTTPAKKDTEENEKWQTATSKKATRGLALKARASGKSVTVTENKKKIIDLGEDIDMGGMGKKKKNRKRL